MKRSKKNEAGFTLIEMLLVMVIMGIMLAVIVPRAWRANVDSKYTLCRQNCTELAKYTQEWCESMLLAQSENSTSALNDYYASLHRRARPYANYIAITRAADNWNSRNAGPLAVSHRVGVPETSVQETMPQDKAMRNPFNGADVFAQANDPYEGSPAGPVTGAIAFASQADGVYNYYALLFQGTDNTRYGSTDDNAFHAGMGPSTIGGVRNGIFVARVR
jgi:prepilin-type N-terminal cleavage/methylation domain-containing protein